MKFFLLVVPLALFAATREECAQMLEEFAPLEKAYDAVVQSQVSSPVSEKIIKEFRRKGGVIYAECKDKMSTTPWYMLGKKIDPKEVDIAKFHLPSAAELTQYALSHPPVIIKNLCGTIQQGVHPLPGR